MRSHGHRVAALAALALSALGLVACSTTVARFPRTPGGLAMMGGSAPGYHFAALTCTPPSPLPGTTVRVMLGDMGMTRMLTGTAPLGAHMMLRAVPATAPAGQVSLAVYNMGWRTHEVVVLPLGADAAAGQRFAGPDGKVDETGSLGEVSGSCAEGAGNGISAGAAGWTTLTLAPGRYELVCNEPNHYAGGMYAELDVA
jgi:uncharacterized cupredoxin-like copper-binding protein